MDVTDEHRAVLELLIAQMSRRADGRGRQWRARRGAEWHSIL